MAARVRHAPGYLASLPVGMYHTFCVFFICLENICRTSEDVHCKMFTEKHTYDSVFVITMTVNIVVFYMILFVKYLQRKR